MDKDLLRQSACMRVIEQFFDARHLEVLADGAVRVRGQLNQADDMHSVATYLSFDAISFGDLVDELRLHATNHGIPQGVANLTAALRQYIRLQRRKARRDKIDALVTAAVKGVDVARAADEWARIESLFDAKPLVPKVALQHFCWQTFQKVLGRPISHHMMPIISSPEQGGGKTTFVNRFVSVWGELVGEATLLSEFADPRSAAIYEFPIVVLDDLGAIQRKLVGAFKSILTSDYIRRRKLGSSDATRIRVGSMPIGTSNEPIRNLVPDQSGHRRFIELPFRNGHVAKGGDPTVWQTVTTIDYALLWASVDPFAPSPILGHLDAFAAFQASSRQSSVAAWIAELDLQSERMVRITARQGVKAQALHDLFCEQTGEDLSPKRFADEMMHCMRLPSCPFSGKVRLDHGFVYVPRRP